MDLATAVGIVFLGFMVAVLIYYIVAPSLVPYAVGDGLISSSLGSIISYAACYAFVPGSETACLIAGGLSALWASLATLYFCRNELFVPLSHDYRKGQRLEVLERSCPPHYSIDGCCLTYE